MSDKEPVSSSTSHKSNEKLSTIQKNAIFQETIRKELRRHQLYEHYVLSPKVKKNLVFTITPNHTLPLQSFENEIEAGTTALHPLPKQKYPSPQTTNQEYFWESKQLLRENLTNPIFYHPRRTSEITKFYSCAK